MISQKVEKALSAKISAKQNEKMLFVLSSHCCLYSCFYTSTGGVLEGGVYIIKRSSKGVFSFGYL